MKPESSSKAVSATPETQLETSGIYVSPSNRAALQQFDELPDNAFVALPVVTGVSGVSATTVWRLVKSKALPAPVKIGNATRWNVGALRRSLAAMIEAA